MIHTDMFFHGDYAFSVLDGRGGPVVYVHKAGVGPYQCDARAMLYDLKPAVLRRLAVALDAAWREYAETGDGTDSVIVRFSAPNDGRDVEADEPAE